MGTKLYNNLAPTGSRPGRLYGLPKVHYIRHFHFDILYRLSTVILFLSVTFQCLYFVLFLSTTILKITLRFWMNFSNKISVKVLWRPVLTLFRFLATNVFQMKPFRILLIKLFCILNNFMFFCRLKLAEKIALLLCSHVVAPWSFISKHFPFVSWNKWLDDWPIFLNRRTIVVMLMTVSCFFSHLISFYSWIFKFETSEY